LLVSSKRTVLFTKDGLLVEVPEDLHLGILSRFAGADPPVPLAATESRSAVSDTRARLAWRDRVALLSLHGRPGPALRLLQLAEEHDHEAFRASETARAMHMSISTLGRLASASFGQPPGIILGLARTRSLGKQIGETDTPLKEVAREHAFPGPSEMGRFFTRYAGESPRLYRSRFRLRL
jgi:AraC-like DNA-binding protein